MKEYQKHMAKLITLGLLLSSGGVVTCADVHAQDLEITSSGTVGHEQKNFSKEYDKVEITVNDKGGTDATALYVHGTNTAFKGNETFNLVIDNPAGYQTNQYTGILAVAGGKVDAVNGVNILINSQGSDHGGDVSHVGLHVEDGGTINLGNGAASTITINNKAEDCYVNGIWANGETYTGGVGQAAIVGKDLNININKDNAEQKLAYASGIGIANGAKVDLSGDLKMHIETSDEIEGLTLRGSNNAFNTNSFALYAKTTAGNNAIIGINGGAWDSSNNDINISGSTVISLDGKNDVTGINFISQSQGKFGATTIDIASASDSSSLEVTGIRQNASQAQYDSLDIKADALDGITTGMDVYGAASAIVDKTLNIDVTGNSATVYGVSVTGQGKVDVKGSTNIVISNQNVAAKLYGIYANNSKPITMDDNVFIKIDAAAGNGKVLNAVYSREDAAVTFVKGLTAISEGNALYAEGGKITVNNGGGNDVQLIGNIGSSSVSGKDGQITADFDTAQSFLIGKSVVGGNSTSTLNFSNNAVWKMTGDSDVTHLTVKNGAVLDMTADSGRYSNLDVTDLTADKGNFIMSVGAVDGEGKYSDKLNIVNSAAGTNTLQIVSNGGLEAAANNNAVLISGAAADTKFIVDGPVYANGLYEYDLELAIQENQGKYDWKIGSYTKAAIDSVNSFAAGNQVAYSAWVDGNSALRQRLSELQSGADNGVWVRMFGGKLGSDEFTNKYKTYQLGYDVKAGDWLIGAAYEYTDGSLNYTSGNGENKIGAVSLYGTLQGKDHSALDIVLKRGRIYGDVDAYGKYSDNGDYSTDAASFGVEYSKRFDAGNDVFVEPQLQLTYGRIDGYGYRSAKGVSVAYDDINSLIGRLGVVAGKEFKRGSAYVKASVLHEFSGSGAVTMLAANGESYKADKDYGETWLELGLGGSVALGKNFQLYGDVERSFGGDVTKNWGANLGVQYSF